jgi:hypothetical protein
VNSILMESQKPEGGKVSSKHDMHMRPKAKLQGLGYIAASCRPSGAVTSNDEV